MWKLWLNWKDHIGSYLLKKNLPTIIVQFNYQRYKYSIYTFFCKSHLKMHLAEKSEKAHMTSVISTTENGWVSLWYYTDTQWVEWKLSVHIVWSQRIHGWDAHALLFCFLKNGGNSCMPVVTSCNSKGLSYEYEFGYAQII